MAKRRRNRNWRNDEKRMTCALTRLPGVSVSQVARRYDVNANQVFNWLKEPQFAATLEEGDVGRFLPVEVVAPVQASPVSAVGRGELEIELASGHRLRISGAYDPDALAMLIRKLSA
jgi:transposase